METIDCNDTNQFPPLVSNANLNLQNVDPVPPIATASSSVVVGGPGSAQTQKSADINQIVGVAPYDLEALAPESDSGWTVQRKRKGKQPLFSIPEEPEDLLRFTAEDDKEELEYWKNSVYGFVLGANPPIEVLEGVIKRLWSKFPIDKISFYPNGVFIVRFRTFFAQSQVLQRGCDEATSAKTRLGFARVMVEVPFGRQIPKCVKFMDEDGHTVSLKVDFEWKPIACSKCKGLGHETANCRKGSTGTQKVAPAPPMKKQWRPKQQNGKQNAITRVLRLNGKYHMVATPAHNIIRLSRQEIVEAGLSSIKFGSQTFLDSLNNVTPRVGIGINGSALPPSGGNYHKGGRIWILWNPTMFSVQFLDYNAQYIHMCVKDLGTGYNFHLTMVYAFNDTQERKPLWDKLCGFKNQIQGPWVICGDYNIVLVPAERLGGTCTNEEMEDFKRCVDVCEVFDCPASGSLYTQCNKQVPETRVYSRLDRVLVNHRWISDNGSVYAQFYCEGTFDHTPCVVQSMTDDANLEHLTLWYSHVQTCEETEVAKEKLRSNPLDSELIQNELMAASSVRFLDQASYDYLLQKSKATWMENVDKNTKYFHSLIKARQVQNKVLKIADMKGRMCEDATSIQNAFLAFYKELLGSTGETIPVSENVIHLGKSCTSVQHDLLLAPISNDEIKEVLFSIPSHKVAGPDGYSSAFFKDAWDTVGGSLCDAVHDFFLNGQLLKQVNHTLISLVPKVALPKNVTEFRPISCCNVVYKCISKLMCNRLARVLPDIISDNQGGFIRGRSIVENILICQDLIRCYNRQSASPRFMLKVDLKKAYDSLNWEFLEQMLISLNFPQQFTGKIMECVRSASYSLSLNGEIFGYFKGRKGLRQGDPLSPLLFKISMEYLSRVLRFTTTTMPFKFHPLCGSLQLSHLMFADDLLLFSKGDIPSIMVLLRSFATFPCASGLQLNPTKTNAYFNGVSSGVKKDILQV
ncbi:uncharacterized protein LOC141617216 [Silene latifolia]|uniref:uncharacterized protein LOC141617216 n=1 Tax=Silene latifolia TaxID=37657 RepID=UPI003D76C55C